MWDVRQALCYHPSWVNSGQLDTPLTRPGLADEQRVWALVYTCVIKTLSIAGLQCFQLGRILSNCFFGGSQVTIRFWEHEVKVTAGSKDLEKQLFALYRLKLPTKLLSIADSHEH